MSYDATEQDVVIDEFVKLLRFATKDGGKKRAAGLKPPWWKDTSHEAAIFSHLNKWKHGEKKDAESGAHPLVHLAWRALAIAYQDTHGKVDPTPLCNKVPTHRRNPYGIYVPNHCACAISGRTSCAEWDAITNLGLL